MTSQARGQGLRGGAGVNGVIDRRVKPGDRRPSFTARRSRRRRLNSIPCPLEQVDAILVVDAEGLFQ